jgi:ABC-type bacteriocin/lantibiotic exporter with double-glycine peptidase domain
MMPKLYDAINAAVTGGIPTNMLVTELVKAGWPPELVNRAVDAWLKANGRMTEKTGFKQWLSKYHRGARGSVVIVVFTGMVQAAVALLKPWPTKIMADSAFGSIPAPGPLLPFSGKPSLIAITALMSITLFIVGAGFSWMSDFILLKIGFKLNRSIKTESLRHILHLPMFHKERLSKGDYVYRQNVVTNSLSDLVLGSTSSIIGSIIMIIGVLAIMVSFNPLLTLVSVVLMPLLYLTMKLIGPHLGKYSQALTIVASDTSSAIVESVDNSETIQAYTLEDKQLMKVDRLWNKGYQLTKKQMIWGNTLNNTNSLLIVLATSTVMYFGGTAAMQGKMSFGQLLIFMTYMGYLLGPVEGLVKQITSRNQKIIDVKRVYEVLSDHEGIEDLRRDNHMPPTMRGVIRFENVTYSYNDTLVFRDLNLTVEQGQRIGIIGPSGGGKSTILKLLPLFIEPNAGRISIDNIDIQTVSLRELRQKIAWVSQTPQLFGGTILDNLYDGDAYRQIDNEEIKNAVIVSNVAEFAVRLPLGLQSPAGENGGSLSGGQRQRVSIARSLIKNAPILCLDEPTAALDTKSENYIRDSLANMIQGKTVMMVTHRKALLALMDNVYVLENGTLVDVNTLGGLDYYLALLEGINQQTAEAQIAEEKQQVNPEQVATDIIAAESSAATEDSHDDIAAVLQVSTAEVAPMTIPAVSSDRLVSGTEVEIKLH